MAFRHLMAGLVLCASLLASGCATVTSARRDVSTVVPGLTYYLPKRDLKVTAERKLLKKDELDKALTAKKGELDTVKKDVGTATGKVAMLTADASSAAIIANPAALAQVQLELSRATAEAARLTAKKGALETEISNLEASLVALGAAPAGTCTFAYSAKLELLAATADRRQMFVATVSHNILRDDDSKLTVGSNGLLSTAKVTATDRTGDILVELAGAIGGFGSGNGVSSAAYFTVDSGPPGSALTCDQLPTKFAARFDPADAGRRDGVNRELLAAGFPFQLGIPDESDGLTMPDRVPDATQADEVLQRHRAINYDLARQGKAGALFYRSNWPVVVTLMQCRVAIASCSSDPSTTIPIDAALLQLPQLGPVSYIPMRSSAFVKTIDDVSFEDGMVVSWSANRPSEALEVVRLPVKLLKAVISVPADIIKLRIDLSDQQKSLAVQQQAEIIQEEKYRAFQRCMKAAWQDEAAQAICFTK